VRPANARSKARKSKIKSWHQFVGYGEKSVPVVAYVNEMAHDSSDPAKEVAIIGSR
jgi:hypothetical protein